METLLQDLRYSLRRLARTPAFTGVVVLTLAMGIGANSAIFSVVYGVLLRPLPFADADRLTLLYTGYPDDETRYPLSPPDFMSLHDGAQSFSGVVAASAGTATVTGEGEPARVNVGNVSEGFFDVLGIEPVLGRGFAPEENQPGEPPAAVVGHAYWQQELGADPGALGRSIVLNGTARTIVGVLPPGFDYPGERDLYLPIVYDDRYDSGTATGRRGEFLTVVGRIAPGVTAEAAGREVTAITERLRIDFPETNSENIALTMSPLRDELLGDVRSPLLILLGAVGLVLLIACVNVANLMLARATSRRGEMSVRTALGAARVRLVRQLLTESILLGLAGGAAGLALASIGTRLLVAARPDGIPRLAEVQIDPAVIAFAAIVSIGTGILFGILPALQITGRGIAAGVREGARHGIGGESSRLARRVLVVVELAFAIVLLVGSGLLVRSFLVLTDVDPGFRSERLLTFDIVLPSNSYAEGATVRELASTLVTRIEGLPGVESAAVGSAMPLTGTNNIFGFDIENREPPPPGVVIDAPFDAVSPGYFETLGIPLLGGRLLTDQDRADSPEVLVVNQAFVRRFFAEEDPIGRRLTLNGTDWSEIVGVVADVPQTGLGQAAQAQIYAPHEQYSARSLTVMLRTGTEPISMAATIRREVAALDADLPIERFDTGADVIAASVAQPRFYMLLLTIFATVALALSAVGIFGVISYLVAERTREIGIRMALGADVSSVLRVIVGGALSLCATGIALGMIGAAAGSRLLSGLVFGIETLDPVTFIGAASVLFAVGALASYLPARAATRVDPNVALRYD